MNQSLSIVLSLIFIITSILAAPNVRIGGRVVGGDDAKEGQFPYIISLRITEHDFHICGGSIIWPNVILTAAHCVTDREPEEFTVVAGTLKLNESGVPYGVEKIIVHEKYGNNMNDLALLILTENITITDNIGIVKIREVDRDENEDCVLSGWGDTGFPEGDTPDNLQFVDLRTTTRKECSDKWLLESPIFENNTCTLTKEGEGACFGDSGGPLVDSEANQIGIVSWGKPCAQGMPDVFTRVASYSDWIKKNGNLL